MRGRQNQSQDDNERRKHSDAIRSEEAAEFDADSMFNNGSFTADVPPRSVGGARQNAILHMQQTYGNNAVRRLLTGRYASQVEIDGSVGSAIPPYMQSAFMSGQNDQTPYQGAISAFRQDHPPALLQRYMHGMAELGNATLQRTPLNQVRRMGRAQQQELPQPSELPGDDEMVTQVLTFFYPDIAPPPELNQQLRDLAAVMLWQAIQASHQMDLVPQPAGARPGYVWLILQAVKMVWRTSRAQGIYVAVRNTVALAHRTEYELAREGVGF